MENNNTNNIENEKIIDLVFAEEEETYSGNWQEGNEDKLKFDINEMVEFKQPWYIRLFNVFAFVVLACASMALLLILAGVAIVSVVRCLLSDAKWKLSFQWWWKIYCRCLVLTLTALVGIFNVQFALTILAVYFSLFDSSSYIIQKLSDQA
jgi:hypothetical protein